MPDIAVRGMTPADLPAVMRVWNGCAAAGEVLYEPLTAAYFARKFVDGVGCGRGHLLVAERDGGAIGFLHGIAPGDGQGAAFLTCLMVDGRYRRQGAGRALLRAFAERMRRLGAEKLMITSLNPVNLDWRIPGTPGHGHNNMPGADAESAGYPFLTRCGFQPVCREMALYMPLSDYRAPAGIGGMRERLRAEGIETGPYDPALGCGFDRMCDAVGSEYWRDALRTEIAAWRAGEPNADPRFWADGARPRGPRTLLTAVCGDQIVGFTGPVDLQKNGRGWFTGICTDPAYGRRGIATVLFHLLMQAFAREGAAFVSLFTGEENPAAKIYLRAGLRPVRHFALMTLTIKEEIP